MHPLFELLRKANLINKKGVNKNALLHMSLEELHVVTVLSKEITSSRNMARENSIFSYSASISLSGGKEPCSESECRINRASNLAQFAALYSDRVYIHNFFADYFQNTHDLSYSINFEQELHLKTHILNDLLVLNYLRPLIEKGRIIPITPPNYHADCLVVETFGKEANKRFSSAIKKIEQQYRKNISAKFLYKNGHFSIEVQGPENLIEHGFTALHFRNDPELFGDVPSLLKKVMKSKEVDLLPKDIKALGLDEKFAWEVVSNILFELSVAQTANTVFLTERDVDVEFLKEISPDPEIEKRNQIIQNNLSCIMPFIQGVAPAKLMELREKEEESFILFRQSLNTAIKECENQKGRFTQKDAKAIYNEYLEPQLALIDKKVKQARKNLIKGVGVKVFSYASAISLGIYTGFLQKDLASIASTLGLANILAQITQNTLDNSDTEEPVRNESMYFLWKVREHAKKY
jgi:hypothetical protein